jgi:serine/threonine protein kinase
VTEHMHSNLSVVIKNLCAQRKKLTMEHVAVIFYQMMSALAYLQAIHVVHRNVHPGHFAINRDLTVKLIDFKKARVVLREEGDPEESKDKPASTMFAAPTKRSMTAQQVVDGMHQQVVDGMPAPPPRSITRLTIKPGEQGSSWGLPFCILHSFWSFPP